MDVPSKSISRSLVASCKILSPVAVVISRGLSMFSYTGVSANFAIKIAAGSGEVSSEVLLVTAAASSDISQRVAFY